MVRSRAAASKAVASAAAAGTGRTSRRAARNGGGGDALDWRAVLGEYGITESFVRSRNMRPERIRMQPGNMEIPTGQDQILFHKAGVGFVAAVETRDVSMDRGTTSEMLFRDELDRVTYVCRVGSTSRDSKFRVPITVRLPAGSLVVHRWIRPEE